MTRRQIVPAVLAAAGVYLCADAALDLLLHPLRVHQVLAYFELMVGAALLVNQAGKLLVPRREDGTRPRGKAWTIQLATVFVPFFLVGVAGNVHRWRGLEVAKSELDSAVNLVAGKGAALDEQALAAALASAPSLRRVIVRVSAAASTVATDGGSIDIDGSTLFVVLPQRSWGYFHNDEEPRPGEDRAAYEQAVAAQADGWELTCRRAEAGWRCERKKMDPAQRPG